MFRSAAIAIFIAVSLVTTNLAQTLSAVRRGFSEPPADSRIMMRWWWFGPSVTKAEIERELKKMKEGGIGGVEVQPVYPLLPDDPATGLKNIPYLSDEFLEMLRFASDTANDLGMRFDLTLGSGWSFGGARTPINEAAGQLRVDRVKADQGSKSVPTPSLIPAEKLMAVFLRSGGGGEFTELNTIANGRVTLPDNIAAGSEVYFFISGKSGMQVKRPSFGAEGYVLDHLDKPSVDDYLKTTGDRLFEAFKGGPVPYSVFCDSLEVYNQDWTDDLLAEFQKRRGYDLRPYLPALVADIGPKTADIRYDWGRTITELFNERFMVPMQEWAERNGTRFRIQGYGIPPASISSNKWADISDGEGAQWKVVRAARWAASANHIYGRSITSSETWTWLHSPVFRATPLDLKAEADIHFLQGINQLIGHGWGYTPPGVEYPGWRFYAAGAYSEQNPWWIVMPDLAHYLQRMSYLMRQGHPATDIALYLPTADAYAGFSAGRVHLIDSDRELVGEKLLPALFKKGYNTDLFDDEILRLEGRAEKGDLLLGAARYKAVVLPALTRMPLSSLRSLDAFVASGGIVAALGHGPTMLPGLNVSEQDRAEFRKIADRLFGGTRPTVVLADDADSLAARLADKLVPDAAVTPASDDIAAVHRKVDGADVYFVANTGNRKASVTLSFRTDRPNAEMWNARTGEAFGIKVTRSGAVTTVHADIEPYGSRVYVFSDEKASLPEPPLLPADMTARDISRDWSLKLGDRAPLMLPELSSWTSLPDAGYFSGVGVYSKTIDLPAGVRTDRNSVILDLGEGKTLEPQVLRNGMQTWIEPPVREAALVKVNGTIAGSVWAPPFTVDISRAVRPGSNLIEIEVGNTALNYMAGRKLPDYRLLNLRYGERFQPQDMEKVTALPSGMLGPITLRTR